VQLGTVSDDVAVTGHPVVAVSGRILLAADSGPSHRS